MAAASCSLIGAPMTLTILFTDPSHPLRSRNTEFIGM